MCTKMLLEHHLESKTLLSPTTKTLEESGIGKDVGGILGKYLPAPAKKSLKESAPGWLWCPGAM